MYKLDEYGYWVPATEREELEDLLSQVADDPNEQALAEALREDLDDCPF
jgi:hypothetical protein